MVTRTTDENFQRQVKGSITKFVKALYRIRSGESKKADKSSFTEADIDEYINVAVTTMRNKYGEAAADIAHQIFNQALQVNPQERIYCGRCLRFVALESDDKNDTFGKAARQQLLNGVENQYCYNCTNRSYEAHINFGNRTIDRFFPTSNNEKTPDEKITEVVENETDPASILEKVRALLGVKEEQKETVITKIYAVFLSTSDRSNLYGIERHWHSVTVGPYVISMASINRRLTDLELSIIKSISLDFSQIVVME